jgi:hypothetical protein
MYVVRVSMHQRDMGKCTCRLHAHIHLHGMQHATPCGVVARNENRKDARFGTFGRQNAVIMAPCMCVHTHVCMSYLGILREWLQRGLSTA